MSYMLYYSPDSANLVIRMALEELQLPYIEEKIAHRRTNRSPEFFRLNPRGLLPVLIDQNRDCALFETGAILLYLADQHKRLAPSAEQAVERAECLSWLFMISNTLHADLRIGFYTDRFVERDSDVPALRAVVRKRVVGHLALLDDAIGRHGGQWLLSSGLSICDFYLACCIRWTQLYPGGHETPCETILSFKHLTKQLTALETLTSVQRALTREGILAPAFIDPKLPK